MAAIFENYIAKIAQAENVADCDGIRSHGSAQYTAIGKLADIYLVEEARIDTDSDEKYVDDDEKDHAQDMLITALSNAAGTITRWAGTPSEEALLDRLSGELESVYEG